MSGRYGAVLLSARVLTYGCMGVTFNDLVYGLAYSDEK
jgi:hypothetical protein